MTLNSQVGYDFPISRNDSVFAISGEFYFHETKTLEKIYEFTVYYRRKADLLVWWTKCLSLFHLRN